LKISIRIIGEFPAFFRGFSCRNPEILFPLNEENPGKGEQMHFLKKVADGQKGGDGEAGKGFLQATSDGTG
jgi:hypothetical protein